MSFKVTVDDVAKEIHDSIVSMDLPVKVACTEAIVDAGSNMVRLGALNIKGHVKGVKLAKSWSARYFPGNSKGRPRSQSINAAVWAYSRIPFLSIFEDGGTIHGKPLLWIPLRNAPLTIGKGITRGHLTPRRLREAGVKLFSITRPGKLPLLATKINASRAAARRTNFNVSLSRLKKSKGPARMTVPLFFGVRRVVIRKKLDLAGIAERERDNLPGYYVQHLKV